MGIKFTRFRCQNLFQIHFVGFINKLIKKMLKLLIFYKFLINWNIYLWFKISILIKPAWISNVSLFKLKISYLSLSNWLILLWLVSTTRQEEMSKSNEITSKFSYYIFDHSNVFLKNDLHYFSIIINIQILILIKVSVHYKHS